MKIKNKWDETYDKTNNRAPWISDEHKEYVSSWLQEHLSEDVVRKRVLDYGCGDGHVGDNFLLKGADVDFAEISTRMVDLLKNKYGSGQKLLCALKEGNVTGEARVFEVSTPMDLPVENESYDYIVVWSVFHHIEPNNWSEFLDSFFDLLKRGGKIIITGRDETDKILEKNGFKGYITGRPVYPINGLLDYIDDKKCDVVEMGTYSEKSSELDVLNVCRYYILKRK